MVREAVKGCTEERRDGILSIINDIEKDLGNLGENVEALEGSISHILSPPKDETGKDPERSGNSPLECELIGLRSRLSYINSMLTSIKDRVTL